MTAMTPERGAGRSTLSGRMWELSIPLRAAFANAAGAIVDRRVVIVSIGDGSVAGWGEAAPYPGVTPDTVDDAWDTLERGRVLAPTAAAAVDEALADLYARRSGEPLWRSIGGSRRMVPTSIAVGLGDEPIERIETTGAAAVKLKIRPGRDVSRVSAVRSAFPDMPIGVDANGSYRWEDRRSLLLLDDHGIDYIEQPFPADDLASHARLRHEIVASVALDEPIGSTSSAIAAIEADAADMLVVKPARLGLAASMAIHDIALAAGLRIKASGLIETAIGRSFTMAVATLPAAAHSDIAAPSWYLEWGVDAQAPMPVRGQEEASDGPGIGLDPDPGEFAPYIVRESVLGSSIWD
jgi:O-succinylbenzoate synthase